MREFRDCQGFKCTYTWYFRDLYTNLFYFNYRKKGQYSTRFSGKTSFRGDQERDQPSRVQILN